MTEDEQRITVQEAAHRLGFKEDAIRKRIQRGTLKHGKDPEEGRVYAYMNTTRDTSQNATYDWSQDAAEDASYFALVRCFTIKLSTCGA